MRPSYSKLLFVRVSQDQPLCVLFVCTANVFRSPLAESFVTEHSSRAADVVTATSASIHDQVRQVHPRVTAVLSEHEIARQRIASQPLSQHIVDAAHLVLTMTGAQAITVASRYPTALRNVFTLDHLVRVIRPKLADESLEDWLTEVRRQPRSYPNQPGAQDILDPVGEDEQFFRSIADQINTRSEQLVRLLAPAPAANRR